jgi:trans-2,3-dihydro-3-hydroxyanthranilate isomerase
MTKFQFETVDVFTERKFGGNPLAVFADARGLSARQMQLLAAEFNLSETTFVLPPVDPLSTALLRIFNRTSEMAFAGHPSIGTAFVLARHGRAPGGKLMLEMAAGLVPVTLQLDGQGSPTGALIEAPQPLTIGDTIPADIVAACIGLNVSEIVTTTHRPVIASMGNPYVFAEVDAAALRRCEPNIAEFRSALAAYPSMNGRFSLHVYARQREALRARMFAPLAGTWEDPATGSANAPLVALLLSLIDRERMRLEVHQGIEMGRASLLIVEARRTGGEIRATVAGKCVHVLRGSLEMTQDDRG